MPRVTPPDHAPEHAPSTARPGSRRYVVSCWLNSLERRLLDAIRREQALESDSEAIRTLIRAAAPEDPDITW